MQGWKRALFATAKAAAVILGSLILGILVGVAVRQSPLMVSFLHRYAPNFDSTIAELIAGAFTSSATVYLSIYVVQIHEIKSTIREALGLKVDLSKATLQGTFTPVPEFSPNSATSKLILCMNSMPLAEQLKTPEIERIEHVAMALPVFGDLNNPTTECTGSAIRQTFKMLRDQFGDDDKFQHVLAVDKQGSGFFVRGYISASNFHELLTLGYREDSSYDSNIADSIAAKANMKDARALKVFNFVTDTVDEVASTVLMIKEMAELRSSEALVTRRHEIVGVAEICRLLKLSLAA